MSSAPRDGEPTGADSVAAPGVWPAAGECVASVAPGARCLRATWGYPAMLADLEPAERPGGPFADASA
jgi:hypothetical protein